MIGQEILPSQVPYTFLDYGVTVIVLAVLGVVLYYVFKTQAKILKDHDDAMTDLVDSMRKMKEALMTLVVDTRHLHQSITDAEMAYERERTESHARQDAARVRYREEQDHRGEQTRHVDDVTKKRHAAEAKSRKAATAEEEEQEHERDRQADYRAEQRAKTPPKEPS